MNQITKELLLLDAEFWMPNNGFDTERLIEIRKVIIPLNLELTRFYESWELPHESWAHMNDEASSWLCLLIAETME
jgi:hypothetical protein